MLLNYQNNYARNIRTMNNAAKNVDVLATSLRVLHNYFDGVTKLFSALHPAKFFTLAKSFFFAHIKLI